MEDDRREVVSNEEREAVNADEVEAHLLDAGTEREAASADDENERRLIDSGT